MERVNLSKLIACVEDLVRLLAVTVMTLEDRLSLEIMQIIVESDIHAVASAAVSCNLAEIDVSKKPIPIMVTLEDPVIGQLLLKWLDIDGKAMENVSVLLPR